MTTIQNCILLVIVLLSMINISKTFAETLSDEVNENLDQQRREYDFNKLRRFLLTADADKRAERREQQNFFKRELVNRSYSFS